MANQLATLLDQANPDHWRDQVGFSDDLEGALDAIRCNDKDD